MARPLQLVRLRACELLDEGWTAAVGVNLAAAARTATRTVLANTAVWGAVVMRPTGVVMYLRPDEHQRLLAALNAATDELAANVASRVGRRVRIIPDLHVAIGVEPTQRVGVTAAVIDGVLLTSDLMTEAGTRMPSNTTIDRSMVPTVPIWLLVGERVSIEISDRAIDIGRLVEGPGRVADPQVSALHAELRPEAGNVVIVDQNSTNGTFVNAKRISSPTRLSVGDEVIVGRTVLTVGSPLRHADPVIRKRVRRRIRPAQAAEVATQNSSMLERALGQAAAQVRRRAFWLRGLADQAGLVRWVLMLGRQVRSRVAAAATFDRTFVTLEAISNVVEPTSMYMV